MFDIIIHNSSIASKLIGAGAIEFIICHAEVSIAFVEEKKLSEVFLGFIFVLNMISMSFYTMLKHKYGHCRHLFTIPILYCISFFFSPSVHIF